MGKVNELRKDIIEQVCGGYFCEPSEDTYPSYFDMYEQLLAEKKRGESFTDVPLWDGISDMTVENLVDLIEGQADMVERIALKYATPHFMKGIDWEMLKEQKKALLIVSEHVDSFQSELDGIIALIDSVQDHACDVLGIDENKVFDLEDE